MTLDAGLIDRVRRRLAAEAGNAGERAGPGTRRLTEAPGLGQTAAAPDLRRLAAAMRAEAGVAVGDDEVLRSLPDLRSELVGTGPLQALLRDPATTDVLVNGPSQVWVDRGAGLCRADVSFADGAAVRRLAVRLAATAGRRLDDAQPWVDVRLPGGVRLHAVLPPVASSGPYLSLRILRPRGFTLAELESAGTLDHAGARLLETIVAARLAFLVSGGTGSGKTTLLATLLGRVAAGERIVIVEDSGELRPAHPHVVGLEARSANVEGAGAVTLRDLVRQALRMRPDRLVVGEVRGAEVVDLLAALNTGHDGGAGTLHANSASDVPARLEALAALGGVGREALQCQAVAAVQCVVHLGRVGPLRVVEEVSVLHASAIGVAVSPAWRRDAGGVPGAPLLRELLAARGADAAAVPGPA